MSDGALRKREFRV